MEQRTNAGYVITDSIHIGETEFVIGQNEREPASFVTWACKNGNDYFWGHYMTGREKAEQDLVNRASEQVRFLNSLRGNPIKGKERER